MQLSAGTALALISEARVEHVEPEADDLYNVVANVSTRVEELSHENTKFLSKKAKAKIRSNFRDIFLTIDVRCLSLSLSWPLAMVVVSVLFCLGNVLLHFPLWLCWFLPLLPPHEGP